MIRLLNRRGLPCHWASSPPFNERGLRRRVCCCFGAVDIVPGKALTSDDSSLPGVGFAASSGGVGDEIVSWTGTSTHAGTVEEVVTPGDIYIGTPSGVIYVGDHGLTAWSLAETGESEYETLGVSGLCLVGGLAGVPLSFAAQSDGNPSRSANDSGDAPASKNGTAAVVLSSHGGNGCSRGWSFVRPTLRDSFRSIFSRERFWVSVFQVPCLNWEDRPVTTERFANLFSSLIRKCGVGSEVPSQVAGR